VIEPPADELSAATLIDIDAGGLVCVIATVLQKDLHRLDAIEILRDPLEQFAVVPFRRINRVHAHVVNHDCLAHRFVEDRVAGEPDRLQVVFWHIGSPSGDDQRRSVLRDSGEACKGLERLLIVFHEDHVDVCEQARAAYPWMDELKGLFLFHIDPHITTKAWKSNKIKTERAL
jgi:hypothetical protein